MMQDMFRKIPLQAAAVVSLISIFNAGGRLFLGVVLRLPGPPQYLSDCLRRAGLSVPADPRSPGSPLRETGWSSNPRYS
jgi:hypothetical protein